MLRAPVRDCADCELNEGGKCVFAKRTLKAGAQLVTQGAVPLEVGFIRRGVIALSTLSRSGDQTWAALRGPRSVLGLEGLNGSPSSSEARALTAAEICIASVPAVKGWLGSALGARQLFNATLTELLEQRRDTGFQTGSVDARVARFALACERFIGGGTLLRPLSKARVAALVGIRPETLSRILHRFTDRGYLAPGTGIKVLDRAALQAIAEG